MLRNIINISKDFTKGTDLSIKNVPNDKEEKNELVFRKWKRIRCCNKF